MFRSLPLNHHGVCLWEHTRPGLGRVAGQQQARLGHSTGRCSIHLDNAQHIPDPRNSPHLDDMGYWRPRYNSRYSPSVRHPHKVSKNLRFVIVPISTLRMPMMLI